MKNFRFQSRVGLTFIFLFSLNACLVTAGLLTGITWLTVAAIVISLIQLMLFDFFTRKHSIIRNYPLKEGLKFVLSAVSPKISKFLLGDDLLRGLVTAEQFEIISNRSENIPTDIIRTPLSHSEYSDFECLRYIYSKRHAVLQEDMLKVKVGTTQCSQPYNMSVLSVGALNQKMLSNASVLALSEGANIRGCAVNTGRSGISPYLIRGGSDLIWQIAQEDYAFRKADSSFNEKLFEVTATRPYVKMIEVVLPRNEASVLKRLNKDRMIIFLDRLRILSGGKPVGIRVFNPGRGLISAICNSMASSGIYLDFITIDGASSAEGYDAIAVSNATADIYFQTLSFFRKCLDAGGLPSKIIASGNIVTEYDILRLVALGANACFCTVPLILALGAKSKLRTIGLAGQRVRVANFHRNTLEATLRLMELCSYKTLNDVKARDFFRGTNFLEVKSLKEIYFDEHSVNDGKLFCGLN